MPPLPRSLPVSPVLALLLGLIVAAAVPAPVALANEGVGPKTSGLPVPRFVTLRSNEVNVRTGPGSRYPIEWVFTRKDMPVEITQEFDTWRRIRDWEGSEGWVHQSMLSGRRGAVITGEVRTLREEPSQASAVVARAKPGVIGALKKCLNGWCQVDIQGYRGWLAQSEFWGAYPNEKVD
ncbi:SH3-like domain-containing protein [Azospirillum fermentarium]|uniref:SH3 domain-containing protein n=1 Tax=Azospirillum fermentarium TaxID=1233114 RepID=UPI002226C697|nr:SH3 domain-containing protein [Azospirillum fermentarium]MCW2244783.1 SH3-like domain-containing protein [Azospirillum fermentarium]